MESQITRENGNLKFRVQTSHFIATVWLGTLGVEIRFPALDTERQSHT